MEKFSAFTLLPGFFTAVNNSSGDGRPCAGALDSGAVGEDGATSSAGNSDFSSSISHSISVPREASISGAVSISVNSQASASRTVSISSTLSETCPFGGWAWCC